LIGGLHCADVFHLFRDLPLGAVRESNSTIDELINDEVLSSPSDLSLRPLMGINTVDSFSVIQFSPCFG